MHDRLGVVRVERYIARRDRAGRVDVSERRFIEHVDAGAARKSDAALDGLGRRIRSARQVDAVERSILGFVEVLRRLGGALKHRRGADEIDPYAAGTRFNLDRSTAVNHYLASRRLVRIRPIARIGPDERVDVAVDVVDQHRHAEAA